MAENQNGDDQGAETTSLDIWLDSTLESVDSAEERVAAIASGAGFDQEELHKLGMAVREAMVNAVAHGNRYSGNKKVHLEVLGNNKRLKIVITDQGEGFDPSSLPDPLAQENLLRQSGRGILMIRAFTDEFEMRPAQPSGTAYILIKYRGRPS